MCIFLIYNLLTGIPVFVLYNVDIHFIDNTNNEKIICNNILLSDIAFIWAKTSNKINRNFLKNNNNIIK